MPRSPIETLIDRACGFDPTATPTPAPRADVDRNVAALLDVADKAVAWLRAREAGLPAGLKLAEDELARAAVELDQIGW